MIQTFTFSIPANAPNEVDSLGFTAGRKLVVTFLLKLAQEALESDDLKGVQYYLGEVRRALWWTLTDAPADCNWSWAVHDQDGDVLAWLYPTGNNFNRGEKR